MRPSVRKRSKCCAPREWHNGLLQQALDLPEMRAQRVFPQIEQLCDNRGRGFLSSSSADSGILTSHGLFDGP